jgi:hypothetical protein
MSVVTTRRGLRRFIGFIVASLVALTPAFGQSSAAPFASNRPLLLGVQVRGSEQVG